MRHFITYGDKQFDAAKQRIINEAKATNWFDTTKAFSDSNISSELRASGLMNIGRGGGLWSWKPDIIHKVVQGLPDGEIVIYADAGCSLQKCEEWNKIERILEDKDLIAQRIFQPSYKWTRREIIDAFKDNPSDWTDKMQFCATAIILKTSSFSRRFVKEWRQLMLENPTWIQDVGEDEKTDQYPGFYENRHDQSIYSALIYRYLCSGHIHTQWERIENYDPIRLQAIRATRLCNGASESKKTLMIKTAKRFVQANILYPIKNIFQ